MRRSPSKQAWSDRFLWQNPRPSRHGQNCSDQLAILGRSIRPYMPPMMSDLAPAPRSERHSLSNWLSLHDLDPLVCRGILAEIAREGGGDQVAFQRPGTPFRAIAPETAWLKSVEAMRNFFDVQQRSIVDETFEKTAKVIVDRPGKPRKALTLDNGPSAYPTILYSYHGEPSDLLTIAHEFAHALQIRASRGKFIQPVVREICAFIGEDALISQALLGDQELHSFLMDVWKRDNHLYLLKRAAILGSDLYYPETYYKYSWNYPIARYLAIKISRQCSRQWIWNIFEGRMLVRDILQHLSIPRA